MSEPVHVGRADEGSGCADVWRHEAGTVELVSDGRVILSPRGAGHLAGLLDRAAMPGQPEAEAPVTKAEVDRCGYSEDPYHRCRVCYDYAAGREREHPLTAAQEAGDG